MKIEKLIFKKSLLTYKNDLTTLKLCKYKLTSSGAKVLTKNLSL